MRKQYINTEVVFLRVRTRKPSPNSGFPRIESGASPNLLHLAGAGKSPSLPPLFHIQYQEVKLTQVKSNIANLYYFFNLQTLFFRKLAIF